MLLHIQQNKGLISTYLIETLQLFLEVGIHIKEEETRLLQLSQGLIEMILANEIILNADIITQIFELIAKIVNEVQTLAFPELESQLNYVIERNDMTLTNHSIQLFALILRKNNKLIQQQLY